MINRLLMLALLLTGFATQAQSNKKYSVGQIRTNMGEILIWLYDETPNHKASFIKLANGNYWDTLTFNRVIKNFVAQGGCPDTPHGFSDSPYLLKPEFNPKLRHIYGAVGAGRDDNPQMLSAGCQFYVVQDKKGIARLDDKYTIFGQVFQGMDVIDRIVSVEKDSTDTPLVPVTLDVNIISMTGKQIKEKGFDPVLK